MKYAVLFEDNDEYAHIRPKFMTDHLQFLADNPGQVQALIEAEPFWPTGLRQSIRILEWTQVYVGGVKMI